MSDPIAEYDIVVLTQDLPEDRVQAGDVGVVLAVHKATPEAPLGFTIEITTVTGETAAVIDVPVDQVRPAAATDIRHSRPAAMLA